MDEEGKEEEKPVVVDEIEVALKRDEQRRRAKKAPLVPVPAPAAEKKKKKISPEGYIWGGVRKFVFCMPTHRDGQEHPQMRQFHRDCAAWSCWSAPIALVKGLFCCGVAGGAAYAGQPEIAVVAGATGAAEVSMGCLACANGGLQVLCLREIDRGAQKGKQPAMPHKDK